MSSEHAGKTANDTGSRQPLEVGKEQYDTPMPQIANLTPANIVNLQRVIGNRGVQRLLSSTPKPKSSMVQRRSEHIPLGGPNGGWGSEQGQNYSNMLFNPHAALYIGGREVQNTWFPNNPSNNRETFQVAPNTQGIVQIVVDVTWFQDNSFFDVNGRGQALVNFEFTVDAAGQITLQRKIPQPSSAGDAALLSILDSPASANGRQASFGVVAQITAGESVSASSSLGGSHSGASSGFSASRSASGGLVRSRAFHIDLVASAPTPQPVAVRGQIERRHPVLFAFDRPRENERPDHLLSDEEYGHLTQFLGRLNPDTSAEIRQGRRPITIVGRASNVGGVGMHNQNLSQRRSDAVRTVLRQIYPQIQFSADSGAIGAIGTVAGSGNASDQVVEIRVMDLQPDASTGANPSPPSP